MMDQPPTTNIENMTAEEIYQNLDIKSMPEVEKSFKIPDRKDAHEKNPSWRFFVTRDFKVYLAYDPTHPSHEVIFKTFGISAQDCIIDGGLFFRVDNRIDFHYHNNKGTPAAQSAAERKIKEYCAKNNMVFGKV